MSAIPRLDQQIDPQSVVPNIALLYQAVGQLQAGHTALKEEIDELKPMVKEVHTVVCQAQGGWRMMITLGTVCAAIGAFIAKVVTWLKIF